ECPSVLIEYCFVTNQVECQALESGTNRDLLAKATVTGIKNYINSAS
ncbi:MAG: N-acetylmuramoyl-L-alanine amidase, partial [Clostridia bacterium]|nr:N-acetylmuramoyl-L-alanine amidase [Clostridia bacterium]